MRLGLERKAVVGSVTEVQTHSQLVQEVTLEVQMVCVGLEKYFLLT